MAIEDAVVISGKIAAAGIGGDLNAALLAYESERYLRGARVTVTARIFGAIIHCDGGSRDLRNHLLEQRTPETFWEIDWLYRGIEA
jgi:salicylate hydroxylase